MDENRMKNMQKRYAAYRMPYEKVCKLIYFALQNYQDISEKLMLHEI